MIIHLQSSIPIYEQIVIQIKKEIQEGRYKSGDPLPSIRKMASEHQISALTVKKAYDQLEAEQIVKTVQGKGTFIAQISETLLQEEMLKEMESGLEKILQKAKAAGLTRQECSDLFGLLLEELYA